MRTRLLHVLGLALTGGLTLVAVVGAVLQWWWLVVLAVMVLVSATFLVALDADRRVRELRSYVRTQVASIDTSGGRSAPSQEDVVGTVRALQAQYTGRLDRLQDTLEASLRRRDEHG